MAGRPRKQENKRDKVTISIDPELLARIDSIARIEALSRSEVIGQMIASKNLRGHVQQESPKGCGIAVAAILSGRTWVDVLALSGNKCEAKGLSQSEMLALLDLATGQHWVKRHRPLDTPTGRWCVLIRDDGDDFGHWIALIDGVIHDPENWNGCPVVLHPRRGWSVLMSACVAD